MVLCEGGLRNVQARFIERLAELPRGVRVAGVDIPIGLPERGPRDAARRRGRGECSARFTLSCRSPFGPVRR
jgi:hypothetical protein